MSLKNNHTLRLGKLRIGLTIGDPSGIGPLITLEAIKKLKGLAEFHVIGDLSLFDKIPGSKKILKHYSKFIDLNNILIKNFSFGRISAEYGRASVEYLTRAVELLNQSKLDCLVTCPISKEALSLAKIAYTGHTEFLRQQTNSKRVVMMLLNQNLRVSLVTRHLPINRVSQTINRENLQETIIVSFDSLKRMFNIKTPKMVLCGLNPHASDNGLFGDEENALLRPALIEVKKKFKIDVTGPLPADIALYRSNKKDFDCAIAMYHDQALIPLKLLGNDTGVNLTLGLPFVRTSPLHGTAFDIAGDVKLANANSLIEAIKLAIKCTLNLRKA